MLLAVLVAVLGLGGCVTGGGGVSMFTAYGSGDGAVLRRASAGPLAFSKARLILDNDQAYRSKLEMVRAATGSIEAMYYIFSNDHSSSLLNQALIDAARRGVKVRLLVDYNSGYKHLDLFSMLEREGNRGKGSLDVRLYGRPTRNMVMDAAYVSLGCGEHDRRQCGDWKLSEVEKSFRNEKIGSGSAASLGISNLNIAGSGLFLSGFYSLDFELMSFAVLKGGKIDSGTIAAGKSKLARKKLTSDKIRKLALLGKTFWLSRTGSLFQQVSSRFKLAFVSLFYGEVVNPIYDALSAYLPLSRRGFRKAARDWEHSWNFLHHKFMLVDDRMMQVGGRNIENPYHMRPNRLLEHKLLFQDTDLRIDLTGGGEDVRAAFERMWTFRTMVASIDEIRAHAPNDFAVNKPALKAAISACRAAGPRRKLACITSAFRRRAAGLETRIDREFAKMNRNAAIYRSRYRPLPRGARKPSFPVDEGALLAYVENLPFRRALALSPRRAYGSKTGREAAHGKHLNDLLIERMAHACRSAGPGNEKRIIINNGYYFLPAGLLRQLSRMLTGEIDCRHVRVTVITNSIHTSDVNIVIHFGRRALAALFDHVKQNRRPGRAAAFEYYEYRRALGGYKHPLHSKVWVVGDDMVVGSLNADIRSLYMDSNNGIYIGGAPRFRRAYTAYIDRLIRSPGKLRRLTPAILKRESAGYAREDVRAFRRLARNVHFERHLSAARQDAVEKKLLALLGRVYELSRQAMQPGRKGRKAGDRYNRLFSQL